jgi:DNA-binding MarR family transcriptional regulator
MLDGEYVARSIPCVVAPRHPLPFDPIAEAARQWGEHGWADAAPGMAAVTSVTRVAQLFLTRIDDALKPFGLTFSRYEVLALLSFTRRGSLPLGKLGDRLQVHPASVTNAIDRLEADGLVRRKPNPRDGRGTLAEITARGRRLVGKATPALNDAAFADIGLSRSQVSDLLELLTTVRRTAGDFEPRSGHGDPAPGTAGYRRR